VTIDPVAYNQQYGERVRRSPSASSRGSDDIDATLADIQAMTARMRDSKATAAEPDVADELTKLATLRDRGILTDAEFATQKAKLLAK